MKNVIRFGAGLTCGSRLALSEADAAAAPGRGASEVVVEAAEPSLEDVFLAVVGAGSRGEEAAPRNPRLRRSLVRIGAMAHKETLHVLRDRAPSTSRWSCRS